MGAEALHDAGEVLFGGGGGKPGEGTDAKGGEVVDEIGVLMAEDNPLGTGGSWPELGEGLVDLLLGSSGADDTDGHLCLRKGVPHAVAAGGAVCGDAKCAEAADKSIRLGSMGNRNDDDIWALDVHALTTFPARSASGREPRRLRVSTMQSLQARSSDLLMALCPVQMTTQS